MDNKKRGRSPERNDTESKRSKSHNDIEKISRIIKLESYDNYLKSILVFLLKIITYNFANVIITNSKKSSESIKKIIFFPKKIKIIYNAYLLNIYKNKKKIKKNNWLLNVGRFCKQKNQKDLLRAFFEFQINNKDYKLVLIEKFIYNYKLSNVHFGGENDRII